MRKFLIPFMAIMIGQALLYYSTTLWGGTLQQMNTNAYEIFDQKVKGRQGYLQNDMVNRWSKMDDTIDSINKHWENLRGGHYSSADLLTDRATMDTFLLGISDDIIYTLRKNSVTGAFIILDQPIAERGNIVSRPGLYVRDASPESSAKDNSDLAIKNGSASLYRHLGITTDISWTPRVSFDDTYPELNAYFDLPMEAAQQYPDLSTSDLGYWSPPISSEGGDRTAFTYSVPLRDATGKAYGIIGVEISSDYMKKMLPSNELNNDKRASYCLALSSSDSGNFHIALSTGAFLSHYLSTTDILSPNYGAQTGSGYISDEIDNIKVCLDTQYLQLYNSGTPFSNNQWVLFGIVGEHDLLSFSYSVQHIAMISAAITVLVGIVFSCIAITLLTKPIRELIVMLRSSNPHKPVTLRRVYVTEIDELSSAIEDLSLHVSESSSTLSRIIELSGINIAAFEVDKIKQSVLCTGLLFPILCIEDDRSEQKAMSIAEFKYRLEHAGLVIEEEWEKGWILRVSTANKVPRWVKITTTEEPNRILGVVADITEETLNKRHIEYERDYDILTNLLNRRAFTVSISKLFEHPEALKISALIMLDLDNLKFINDSYGHDCGDGYLRAAANAMKKLQLHNMLLARMSGDEFFIFIYGYDSKDEIRSLISELKQIIGESYYILPGADSVRVRCSAGVTWYPDDTLRLEELTRYADFAMYSAKNTKKGDFREFIREDYDKNSYLLHSREELNKLIEHSMLDYYFQPIVNARTGEVFAYEALMRSRLKTLRTPLEILALARSQSKLYEIEKLTWFTAMSTAVSDPVFNETNCKIFINSVSNNMLSDDDIESLRSTFQRHLHRMVLEVTEEEKFNEDLTRKKQDLLYKWGGSVALDDFGTGYNGEMALLQLVPDYVKIDMSIVRNINADQSRQELFRNLVSYSNERKISVIAEGVETFEEMRTLIQLGCDYLQGYYLGKPEPKMLSLSKKVEDEIRSLSNSLPVCRLEAK